MNRIWRRDEDITYRGYLDQESDFVIDLERTVYNGTEREDVQVIGRLTGEGSFGWGYTGEGPSQAADAVLSDALGGPVPGQLWEDFSVDVLSQFGNEWRLRRGAVLRWALGWAIQHDMVNELPAGLVSLPPVDRADFAAP